MWYPLLTEPGGWGCLLLACTIYNGALHTQGGLQYTHSNFHPWHAVVIWALQLNMTHQVRWLLSCRHYTLFTWALSSHFSYRTPWAGYLDVSWSFQISISFVTNITAILSTEIAKLNALFSNAGLGLGSFPRKHFWLDHPSYPDSTKFFKFDSSPNRLSHEVISSVVTGHNGR